MPQGDPPVKHGEVTDPPPNTPMPPETGFTPFWEKHRGLLYVPDPEVPGVDLSVGSFITFRLKIDIGPTTGTNINIAYDISNF